MENEIREMNIMPQQRSKANHQSEGSSLSNSSLKAFQTFSTQFHSDDRNATKEKENLQLNETSNQTLFNSAAISEISQNQKVQEESESLVQKVLIEKVLDNKDKKESSSKSQINKKSSNGQISMMKLSRNGGIENNLSRKEIERPSWRSELLGNKYQPQDVKSSESKVYFQISSSLQESESNITKLVEKSEKLASLETHVQQSSEAPRGEIYDEKKELIDKTQSRTKEEIVEPREEDIIEAANFGMQAMNDLYYIKEPKLYSLGLFLSSNNPARHVANFNDQSAEARHLAKFGYAALEGAKLFISKFPELLRESALPRSTKHTDLNRQCPKRGIPQCPPASLRYRTADGSCNNPTKLWWGSAMSNMQRFLPPVYHDGIQSIRRSVTGKLLPSARKVSNLIHEDRDIPLASVSHMLMQWGQFVDHDITATGQSRGFNGTIPQCCLDRGTGFQSPELMHPDCLPIAVHSRDNFFGPLGVRCLEFVRSGPAPRENCEFGPREQISQVTSYLDASTVYSSNALHSDSLRIFRDGLLQYGKLQSRKHMFVKEESDVCQLGSLSQSCFRAGDGRLGENPALTSLHVVFLRLHNRITTQIAALNPHWSDEKMFQETRKIVGAIIQHITYREYLPIVLGHEIMKIFDLEILKSGYFKGYDPTVNPNIANEFASAAYRFGHSLVQPSLIRFDRHHRPLFNNVSLHEEFVNPNLQSAGSLDRIILGLVNQPSQKRDEFISEELTNHLFQTQSFPFGMDLASLNIQRGRDHGIPSYVQFRTACTLSPINNWQDLKTVMTPSTARKFENLYSSVDDIDLFPAGLSEKPVVGGLVGPTFACIIAQQFSNLRKGDRFWFENPNKENKFTPRQLQQIRSTTLAQVLCRTMDNIESVQPFVMLLPDVLKNVRIPCNNPRIGNIDIQAWAELPPKEVNETEEREEVDSPQAKVSISKVDNINKGDQKQKQPIRPLKSNINQQNRIILKRPIGPQENITIFVKNVAINTPIFVNDAIYGSNIQLNTQPTSNLSSTQIQKPIQSNDEEDHEYDQELPFYPTQRSIKPKPSQPSLGGSNPYIPHNFEDSNNPNPPSYGFNSNPVNNYIPSNAYFETMYNYNYKPEGEIPNFNQESNIKPVSESSDYNPDKFPQNVWTVRPDKDNIGYHTKPTSGSNQNIYSHNRPENVKPVNQNFPNYNRPFSGKPSDHDNPNPPISEGSHESKPVIQNFPNYQEPISVRPTNDFDPPVYQTSEFYQPRPTSGYIQNILNYHRPTTSKPTSQRPTRRPIRKRPTSSSMPESSRPHYWPEKNSASDAYSDHNYKVYNADSTYSKPVTIPDFTVVSETLETVRFTEPLKTTSERKSVSELPRPLIPHYRIHDHSLSERAEIAGPGLHYFNENVLYKYPQKIENLTKLKDENDSNKSKDQSEKEFRLSSQFDTKHKEEKLDNLSVIIDHTIDQVTDAEVVFEEITLTTPTIITGNNDINQFDLTQKLHDEQEDEEDEAVIVETIVDQETDSMKMPEVSETSEVIFPNLTFTIEQPEFNFEFPSSEELPMPIKLRTPA